MSMNPQDLLREIDQVLNTSLTKDEIKDKLSKSRSNSVNNSRSNSVSGRNASSFNQQPSQISQQETQNQTMPQYNHLAQQPNYQQYQSFQQPQNSFRDNSIITPQNQPMSGSVVHNKYETPQSLNINSPSLINNQNQISQLQDEISRLTNQSLRSDTPGRNISQQQITPQNLQNLSPVIQENQPSVQLREKQNQQNQQSKVFQKQQSEDTFMDANTTFSSVYIDELQKENIRLKKNYINKELNRMKALVEAPILEKEEIDYVIENAFKQFIRI